METQAFKAKPEVGSTSQETAKTLLFLTLRATRTRRKQLPGEKSCSVPRTAESHRNGCRCGAGKSARPREPLGGQHRASLLPTAPFTCFTFTAAWCGLRLLLPRGDRLLRPDLLFLLGDLKNNERKAEPREPRPGGAQRGARSRRAALPAAPAAAALARPGRAPPLLGRRRLAAPRRAGGGAPGAPLLGLHRHLPPPPPLPPPLGRRLHGAAGRHKGKCAPLPARARKRFRRRGGRHRPRALLRLRTGGGKRRPRRHGDSGRGRHDHSLLRYNPPVLVTRRTEKRSPGVSGAGPDGAPAGYPPPGTYRAPLSLSLSAGPPAEGDPAAARPDGARPAAPDGRRRRRVREAAAGAPQRHPAAAVSGAGPGPAPARQSPTGPAGGHPVRPGAVS